MITQILMYLIHPYVPSIYLINQPNLRLTIHSHFYLLQVLVYYYNTVIYIVLLNQRNDWCHCYINVIIINRFHSFILNQPNRVQSERALISEMVMNTKQVIHFSILGLLAPSVDTGGDVPFLGAQC